MGRALFNACLSSCSNDGILLAKAAQIIKDLLRHEQQFNGDISRERQFEGIPSSIFQLISLIIEGGYTQDSTPPECSEKIIGNLSQLVIFNTVKNKREETVLHVRHSKLKEPPFPVYLGMLIHNKTRKKGLVNEFAEQRCVFLTADCRKSKTTSLVNCVISM